MKPGDLRKFSDSMIAPSPTDNEWSTFIVLKVSPFKSGRLVDILLDGSVEEGLGYFWVQDNSEVLDETG